MNEDIIDDGFGTAASAVCPACGHRDMYVVRPGDIRCARCEVLGSEECYNPTIRRGVNYTGTCPVCYRKFSDCECDIETIVSHNLNPAHKEELIERLEIKDIIYTIARHCEIAELIMEQGKDYLISTISEDICELAQELASYCVKEG